MILITAITKKVKKENIFERKASDARIFYGFFMDHLRLGRLQNSNLIGPPLGSK